MELKPAYKPTEAGIIPKEWKSKPLGEVVDFSGGAQPPRSTFVFSPKPGYVRLIQIRDYKSDDFATYIPEVTARKWCSSSDIMIGRYGPPVFQILRGIEGAYNVALLKTIPTASIDREFLYYVLRQDKLFSFIEALSQRSSGQTGVELPALRSYEIPLPPLPEQRAIAAALSDTDALLSSLDRLLAKKRDIKQAVMQQLLTGKQRLPGFSGEWELKRLGDVSNIKTGKRNGDEQSEDGLYPFFVRSKVVERINSYSFDGEAILIPGEGGIGSIYHYINGKFDYHQRVYKISDFAASMNGKFVYYCMTQFFNEQATRNSVKATVDSLRLPTFVEFEFFAPLAAEQTAIAAVLSDMDAEIDALQQRRDKTRAIKQGMMQELLTGRTRLVEKIREPHGVLAREE